MKFVKPALFEKMAAGSAPLGMFVGSPDPVPLNLMASAGLDYVVFDCEHSAISREQVQNLVYVAEAVGIAPFARVLQNSTTLIQSTLETGVQGIIVPHVDDAEEARYAVAASRYAPAGRRGMAPNCHSAGFDLSDWDARSKATNANMMIVPMIESRKSVDNIEQILAVDGVDIVFFGPGDLSADMGIDLMREGQLLIEPWIKVRDAARAAKKYVMAVMGGPFEGADILLGDLMMMVVKPGLDALITAHQSGGEPSPSPAFRLDRQ